MNGNGHIAKRLLAMCTGALAGWLLALPVLGPWRGPAREGAGDAPAAERPHGPGAAGAPGPGARADHGPQLVGSDAAPRRQATDPSGIAREINLWESFPAPQDVHVRLTTVRERAAPEGAGPVEEPALTTAVAEYWWREGFLRSSDSLGVRVENDTCVLFRESSGLFWLLPPRSVQSSQAGSAPEAERVPPPGLVLDWVRWLGSLRRRGLLRAVPGGDGTSLEGAYTPASAWPQWPLTPADPGCRLHVRIDPRLRLPVRSVVGPEVGAFRALVVEVRWQARADGEVLPAFREQRVEGEDGRLLSRESQWLDWDRPPDVDWEEQGRLATSRAIVLDQRRAEQQRIEVVLQPEERGFVFDVARPDAGLSALRERLGEGYPEAPPPAAPTGPAPTPAGAGEGPRADPPPGTAGPVPGASDAGRRQVQGPAPAAAPAPTGPAEQAPAPPPAWLLPAGLAVALAGAAWLLLQWRARHRGGER